MHYRIVVPTNNGAAKILRETLAVLKEDTVMQPDLNRLNRTCRVPQKGSALDGAPKPTVVEALACSSC